jgi:hypothetical protein
MADDLLQVRVAQDVVTTTLCSQRNRASLMTRLVVLLITFVSINLVAQQSDNDVVGIQQQLNELKATVDTANQRIQQLQQQLIDRTQSRASAASANVSTPSSYAANSNVSPRAEAATTLTSDKAHPKAIQYRGITLTPVGFFDVTGVYRTHNENADVTSTFAGIPFSGTTNSNLSEFRGSARASRIALLSEGTINTWKASGYAEFDFEGAAPNANEIDTNSFNPRVRQLWAQLEFKNGISVAGGQTYSLLTTHRKGIELRQEMLPLTIDLQFVDGFNWARQASFRVTKNFNDKVWAAVALENPETSLNATNAPAGVAGFNTSVNATTPVSAFTLSNTPGANGISTDAAPDLVGKLAFEPGWGHYELKAVGRFFRDRFNAHNNYTEAGGAGFGAILPVTKKLNVIVEGLAGSGIGRYSAGLGPDVTLRPDGTIVPIRSVQTMAGVEFHPTARWDWYLYGGDEYYGRAAYTNSLGKGVGYGSPLNDNSGCQLENPATTQPCQAQTRALWQIQPGFWYRFYKGEAGTVALGMSYSYTDRTSWAGLNGLQPKGVENIVMTSFRYYIP